MAVRTWNQWTVPEIKKLKALATQGMPAMYIAETMDRTKWSVQCKARELGIKLKSPSERNFRSSAVPEYYFRVIELLAREGLTSDQISAIFKQPHRVSRERVDHICATAFRQSAGRDNHEH